MGGVFKKPKKPDTREQDRLIQEQKNKIKEQESEVAYAKASKTGKNKGRASLITGSELGITNTPTRTTTG